MGSCCCVTQKQGEDHSSAVEELFPYLLELRESTELQGWPPEDAEGEPESHHWQSKPVNLPVSAAGWPHIGASTRIAGFFLHRIIYINIYVRAGWWRLWKEARFEVHGERMKELPLTILFAQIFHFFTLSVCTETFCELSSPIHNCGW